MALSNYDRVGRAMDQLKTGLMRFVEREMKSAYGETWQEMVTDIPPRDGWVDYWDVQKLLLVMWDQWAKVFSQILGHTERSLVSELRETRNQWAHQKPFSTNDTLRALDSTARLLNAISASAEHAEVEKMRMDLLRLQFEEMRRNEMRKSSFQPTEGKPMGGLKPWREVITPHPDVASGRYQQAEFAADLWQVYLGEGSDEYKHPTEFFRRTFLTEGLRQLLVKGLERLANNGGDPVVELQTNFGGGKTHSMLALWHIFSGSPASDLPGVEELLKDTAVTIPHNVRRVVLVGTKISPGQPVTKPDGTLVRTLWGEIAWQLGGKEGYAMVKEDDEKATNPGDRLRELFNRYSPCLILIDEWVAYARQLHEGTNLPAGTFETQFTFAQALSESAKAAKNTMLVVSIPASDNEIGGEWGKKALERLKNAIGRVESPWRPASQDEGFEIVRRRLFQPLTHEQAVHRDAVARAFIDFYGTHTTEFPIECREGEYERRIKMAYPIHPELFDRLYNDWSTLDKFQRTRGVLRLMAAVIHSLWERQDANLLIMPATVPIDDSNVQFELTRYLEDQWVPVIEKDVDGPHSLPLSLDRDNPNLGRFSACRRIARTIYLGSAPTIRASNRGIDEKRVKLGCVQPGETVPTFGDALRRLTDKATYLYVDGTRYWYSTQPSVTRTAEERAERKSPEDVWDEIQQRLNKHARTRGDFSKVHVCTRSQDIPDERDARLIVLHPKFAHTGREDYSPAIEEATNILSFRGSSPRTYRNTLVFLAPDSTRLSDLESAVRYYLAWSSILHDQEELNLDNFQKRQAETKKKSMDDTIEARIPETYQWLIVPTQPDVRGEIEWETLRLQGQDELTIRASKKLKTDEMLLTEMGGVRLRLELDRVPLWRGDHVSIKQLIEDFATYLYLPRLRDEQVLISAIKNSLNTISVNPDTFVYAAGFDAEKNEYLGLQFMANGAVFSDSMSLLVKPGIAQAQLERKEKLIIDDSGNLKPINNPTPETDGGGIPTRINPPSPVVKPKVYHRFHGHVTVDAERAIRDFGTIKEEIINQFTSKIKTKVKITIYIDADIENGADEKLIRDVSENCKILHFDACEFEE